VIVSNYLFVHILYYTNGVCRFQQSASSGMSAKTISRCISRHFFFEIHTASAPITAGTHTDGGAVIRKPGSTWLEGTPAMDLGHMNVALKWMYLRAYEWCAEGQSDSSSSLCIPKLFRAVIWIIGMDYRKWVGVVCVVLLPHVNMAWQLTPQIVSIRNRAVGFSRPPHISFHEKQGGCGVFSSPAQLSASALAARGGLRAEAGVDGQRPVGIRMVPTRREVYRTLRASVREAVRGRCGHAEALEHLQAS